MGIKSNESVTRTEYVTFDFPEGTPDKDKRGLAGKLIITSIDVEPSNIKFLDSGKTEILNCSIQVKEFLNLIGLYLQEKAKPNVAYVPGHSERNIGDGYIAGVDPYDANLNASVPIEDMRFKFLITKDELNKKK